MPVPKKRATEQKSEFIQRCMSDDVMKKEYPKTGQRLAMCNIEANKLNKS